MYFILLWYANERYKCKISYVSNPQFEPKVQLYLAYLNSKYEDSGFSKEAFLESMFMKKLSGKFNNYNLQRFFNMSRQVKFLA